MDTGRSVFGESTIVLSGELRISMISEGVGHGGTILVLRLNSTLHYVSKCFTIITATYRISHSAA